MKLKDGFVIRKIAGRDIVLPTGNELNLNHMISLNESGMFIWKQLREETTADTVADALAKHYDISFEDAKSHTLAFIEKLKSYDYLED